jgi:hypothetical protein
MLKCVFCIKCVALFASGITRKIINWQQLEASRNRIGEAPLGK